MNYSLDRLPAWGVVDAKHTFKGISENSTDVLINLTSIFLLSQLCFANCPVIIIIGANRLTRVYSRSSDNVQHGGHVITRNEDEYLLYTCQEGTFFVIELCETIKVIRYVCHHFNVSYLMLIMFNVQIGA